MLDHDGNSVYLQYITRLKYRHLVQTFPIQLSYLFNRDILLSEIKITKTMPTDFLAIAALDRVAWLNNAHGEFIPDGEHAWRIWCQHAVMYSAKCDDEIVGAILAFACEDGRYCLHKVMVDDSQRGKGIGGMLFKTLFDELDEKRVECFLTVDPNNSHAIALYESWGFDERELVEGFYRAHEHRYVMTRKP